MNRWSERPLEVAALLNPWFCGVVLAAAADGYRERAGVPMPLSLAFVVLPLVLHGETSRHMPATSATKFGNWIFGNRTVLLGFPQRARNMLPFTREAMLAAFNGGILLISEEGIAPLGKTGRKISKANESIRHSAVLARRLGLMLAHAGAPSTVFALLGVGK